MHVCQILKNSMLSNNLSDIYRSGIEPRGNIILFFKLLVSLKTVVIFQINI